MKPARIDPNKAEDYLAAGHWSRETMVDRYAAYARECPDRIACRDWESRLTWRQLDKATDWIAAALIARGIPRNDRALVQIPSSNREMMLRIAFKKAGVLGSFAPMSGAAGVLVWAMSGTMPCLYIFPRTFEARTLLRSVEDDRITVATTAPVILPRLAQEDLAAFDLRSLRALRVGTGAAGLDAARRIESRTDCRVVVASGVMECPGFGHADVDEPAALRLDGTTGSPLPGCSLRIEDDDGTELPTGEVGHVKVSAPFSALGYWNDPESTRAVWADGWYATRDMGVLDDAGRLTLLGRFKEVINRSGHKILPLKVELELAGHPDVFQCAVVAAPDAEYGEVPWAFVQMREGRALDADGLVNALRTAGLATYKIPARFIELTEFPRVGGNKIDKKRLLEMAPAA